MIAADGNGRLQLATPDQVVDRFAHLGAFAVTEPANAGWQTLKLHPVARQAQPAIQGLVIGKKFQREVVRLSNIIRVAGQGDPTERSFAFTKERANVLRHKAGNL